MSTWRIISGDCREAMRSMAEGSIDAVVTDPPYGLAFMGKAWDHGVPGVEFWTAALRVAKPGAHLVAFGGTRTFHRLTCAIEDAGWEIRDTLCWLYGTGFPKALDVSKAIDKAAGAERQVIGLRVHGDGKPTHAVSDEAMIASAGKSQSGRTTHGMMTIPTTDAAKQWEGWGTALKPAWEPIILARKPFKGNVAATVLKHGTGALNIDGTRIATDPERSSGWSKSGSRAGPNIAMSGPNTEREPKPDDPLGRWPANLVLGCACGDGPHDPGCAVRMLDEQSGESASPETVGRGGAMFGCGPRARPGEVNPCFGDSGGASRFFFCAKASRSEREEGLVVEAEYEHSGPRGHTANGDGTPRPRPRPRGNTHPTVKPVNLLSWLVRLVTPPGGTVLDPFCGSGSTGVAAVAGGWDFVGVEKEPEYVAISRQRIGAACPMFAQEASENKTSGTLKDLP